MRGPSWKGESRARVAWYALEGDDTGDVTPTWLGAPAAFAPDGSQTFDLFVGGIVVRAVRAARAGAHNVRNAVAALAACVEGFGASVSDARAHLASFEGVKRRQDLLGEPGGVRVYDDFAHHPTAVDETLRALRARHPDGALWVAFEPRSATACRALHQEAYARAFDAADHVLLAPLGRTNVPADERLDLDAPGARARAEGQRHAGRRRHRRPVWRASYVRRHGRAPLERRLRRHSHEDPERPRPARVTRTL